MPNRLKSWGISIKDEELFREVNGYDLGFVGDYVLHAQKMTDAPTIYQVGCGLVLMSALLGPALKVAGDQLTLWILLLGPSGRARKSTCLHMVEEIIYNVDYECVLPVHFSLQSLVDMFQTADGLWRGLFLPYDEFSQFLSRYTSVEMLSGVGETMIKAYDGAPLGYNYKQSGHKQAFHPFLAFLATGVPETLGRKLERDMLTSGFLARWILLHPEEGELGQIRLSPFGRPKGFPARFQRKAIEIAAWYQRIVSSMGSYNVSVGDETHEVVVGQAKQILISQPAIEIMEKHWYEVEEQIENGQGSLSEGKAESLARARERATRMAALLAIGDGPPKGAELPEIQAHHAAAGVILSTWFEERRSQAVDTLTMHYERRVTSVQVVPAMKRLAEKRGTTIRLNQEAPWFRRTDIQREANIGRKATRSALEDLIDDGTVQKVELVRGTRGRDVFYALTSEIKAATGPPSVSGRTLVRPS